MSTFLAKTQYVNYLALALLDRLGNVNPTQVQIDLAEKILAKVAMNCHINFDHKLTEQEFNCLYWAAMGKTSKETGKLLNIQSSTVETHRKKIKRKLDCSTMAQAIFEGIRYGYLTPKLVK